MHHIMKPLLHRPLLPLLIVVQVALACAITTNTLFLLQARLAPILATDGIGDPAQLVFVHGIAARGTPWDAPRLRAVEMHLRGVPKVASVSYAASLPMMGSALMRADVRGPTPGPTANAVVYFGDHLVETLGLTLVAGSDFSTSEAGVTLGPDMGFETQGSVIVTRALANQLYPDGKALGKIIRPSDSSIGERVIIGIVDHLVRNKFGQDNHNLDYSMLFPGVPNRWPVPMFAVRFDAPSSRLDCDALLNVIDRDLGAGLLPGHDVACDPYTELRENMLARPQAAVWLLSGVSLIVLIVTLTGILGVTGYWVQQRTRSIGIRRALGGRRRDVLHELLLENLLVVSAGSVIGVIGAYGVNLWLMQHYELMRLPWTYVVAGSVLLIAVGQISALAPVRHASHIPPIVATRSI